MDKIANAEKNIDDAKVRHTMERQRLNQQLKLAKDAKKKERERENKLKSCKLCQKNILQLQS